MNRRTFLSVTAGLTGAACNRGPRLNVYNWSDYIAPPTVPDFEREFGLRVHYGTYESNQEMLAKVMSGNSGWDVAFPSEDFVGPMRDLGLLAPLDHDLLPNLKMLDAVFQQPPWDPNLQWSVPYMHGSTGILYQTSLHPAPRRWSDMWDPRLRGRVTMLDDQFEVFAACLEKLGHSINTADAGELTAATKQAILQKPLLRAYLNAEVRDQAVAGDVLAAQAWAVTAAQAINGAPGKLAFALPTEGFPRFADNIVVLKESQRRETAHRWMNYLLRPEVAAAIITETHTASANGAATRLLPAEIRENPVLYPPVSVYDRGEWFQTPSPASQKLRDRLWTQIKSS